MSRHSPSPDLAGADREDHELAVLPSFVVRVAGLPMAVLGRLRCEATIGAVDELLELQDQLLAEGEQLSEALYDVIGSVDEPAVRRRLLALRRCVYQARAPRSGVLDDDVRAVLPAELATRITGWQQRLAQQDALWVRAEATCGAESIEKRWVLAEVAGDDWFQQGLVLASPDLSADLVKWLAGGPQARPDEALEASLVKYVSRAAAKTTPYSTFTSLAEGRWRPAGLDPVRCAGTWTRCGAVEPAVRIALHLRRELASWPEVRSQVRLRVNSSLAQNGTMLRFLAHRGGETVAEVALTPTLRRVLEVIRAAPEPGYAPLAAALAELDPALDAAELAAYLDHLVDLGLLEAQLRVPDQSLDHLRELSDLLAGCPGHRVEALRELLERLRGQLARLADGEGAPQRRAWAGAVDETLQALYTQLDWTRRGVDVPVTNPVFKNPVFKNSVFEDTVVAGLDYRFALSDWAGVLADLRLLAGLSGLYDRHLAPRLALAAFFADRYGPGARVGLLEWCRAVCDEQSRPGADLGTILTQPWLARTAGLDTVDQIKRLRRQMTAFVRKAPVDQDGIRRLDRAALSGWIAALPEFAAPHESIAFYGQPMIRDGTPYFVLNNTDAGFRRAHARFQRFAARAHGDVHPTFGLPADNGVVYADVATIGGSNLNLRLSPASYEIAYPGSVSNRPAAEQIRLGDLDVVHDVSTGGLRLVWRSRPLQRAEVQVIPLHLGTLVDWALPWTYRLLMQTFSVSTFAGLPQRLSGLTFLTQDQGVRWVPRLCLGEVVIERATWLVGSSEAPVREKNESALSHLIRVTRWRREHRIPPQCFVRAAVPFGAPHRLGKDRKPCYIDFSSQVFLRVFAQIAAQPDRILVFQEVLPTDDDLLVTDGDARYASECVFELDRCGKEG